MGNGRTGNGAILALERHVNTRFDTLERQLTDVSRDVKRLSEARAILEGKTSEIDKKASRTVVNASLLIASAALLVAAVSLYMKLAS